jgi:hypothetical protein
VISPVGIWGGAGGVGEAPEVDAIIEYHEVEYFQEDDDLESRPSYRHIPYRGMKISETPFLVTEIIQ